MTGDRGNDSDPRTPLPRLVLAEESVDEPDLPTDDEAERDAALEPEPAGAEATEDRIEQDESTAPEPPRVEPAEPEARRDESPGGADASQPRPVRHPTLRERRREGRKPTQALVYVQKLTKLYPIQRGWLRRPQLLHALNGVSFYVRRNETFGLVGESGCGKSTLGRCLIRLTEPTVGRVIFDGRDVTSLPPSDLRLMRQRMQIVFQDPYSSLNPNMTVTEIVREGIDVFGLAKSRAEAEQRVASLLEKVGLKAEMMDRYPHEFSGGQRQRIAIARALAVEPDFVVLDEPLTALDLSVQAQIVNLLDDLQQNLGLTLLFISHDLRTVQYLSHRMAVMYRGKFMEMGPTGALTRRRFHPYTRALFDAMPRAPWLPGEEELPPSSAAPPTSAELRSDSMPDSDRMPAAEPAPPSSSQSESRLRPGEPPSPVEVPRGCPLFTRCPRAETGQCDEEEPDLIELSKGSHHRVACWHPFLD